MGINMSVRRIAAGNLKKGNYFLSDSEVCNVLDVQHSKSCKHGHAKNRVSCVGLFDKKKRSLIFSSGAMVDVPEIKKSTGQVTDVGETTVTIMDLETFETKEIPCPDQEVFSELEENGNCEYWDIEGEKIIKRKL